jgi:hypothetical protein
MRAPQTSLSACSDLATATESAGTGFVIDMVNQYPPLVCSNRMKPHYTSWRWLFGSHLFAATRLGGHLPRSTNWQTVRWSFGGEGEKVVTGGALQVKPHTKGVTLWDQWDSNGI